MKQEGLVSRQFPQHKYAKQKRSIFASPVYRVETSAEKLNQVESGDVTYVWSGSRWMYLAVVIVLFIWVWWDLLHQKVEMAN